MNIQLGRIHSTPKEGDKLSRQYFSDVIQLRANMNGLTGSGTLIATWDPYFLIHSGKQVEQEMRALGADPRDHH